MIKYLSRKYSLIFLISAFSLAVSVFVLHQSESSENPITVNFPDSGAELRVEVAETPEERRKGLMFREDLPIDEGMLFVFPNEEKRGFWMKNTLIPLDMIFVSEKGRIVNIEEAYPEPNTSEENLTIYESEAPAKYVIEANSSLAERRNVEEGDRVGIPTQY